MADDDFGFSFVSGEELKKHQEMLQKKLDEHSEIIEKKTVELQDRLNGLRDLVMPLLKNLTRNPELDYVYWPDRAKKVQEFIDKVNKFVEGKK